MKKTWLVKWKTKRENLRWREVIYRAGFTQSHLSTLITPAELTEFLHAVTHEKDRLHHQSRLGNLRPWQIHSGIANMFRSFRKMIRYRHLNRLSADKIYKAHSTVYGSTPATRWQPKTSWCRIEKESILLFTGMSEFGEPVFMYNNGLVTVCGSSLDKIRCLPAEQQNEV